MRECGCQQPVIDDEGRVLRLWTCPICMAGAMLRLQLAKSGKDGRVFYDSVSGTYKYEVQTELFRANGVDSSGLIA